MFHIINSSDKTTGTTGNCSINLNQRIKGTYSLYSFVFTNNLYNVNSNNNRIVLTNTSDTVLSNSLIPEGYYTGAELASKITSEIASLTATFDENTAKFTFTYSSDFKLKFASYDNTIHELIGFEKLDYTSSSSSLTSVEKSDLIPCKNLYITIKQGHKPIELNSNSNHHDYSFIINDSQSSFGSLFRYKQSNVLQQQYVNVEATRRFDITIYDNNHNTVNTSNCIMILEKKS